MRMTDALIDCFLVGRRTFVRRPIFCHNALEMQHYWNNLKMDVEAKRLLLLGEKHGADINPDIIGMFVSKLGFNTLAIEIEPKWQKTIDTLRKYEASQVFRLIATEPWIFKSGVISLKHLILFKNFLRLNNNKIITIGVQNKNWNLGDKLTTRYLTKLIKKGDKTLVIMGNLHTRKSTFKTQSEKFIPLGYHLRDSSIAVRIRYGQGTIFNFRKMMVQDMEASKLIKKSDRGLIKSASKYFDYDYIITKKVKPLIRKI